MLHVIPESARCLDDCLIARAMSGLCVGLILTNHSERVIWANRAAARVLGVGLDECLGKPLPHLLKDLQLSSFWQETAGADGNVTGEVSVRWPEPLSLKVNATRYVAEDGQVVGRALLFCDVTAERAVQVELSEEVAHRLLDLTSTHSTPEPLAALTQQEVRVLRLVGRGLSNDQIADQMAISASTVRTHLKNLYRKLSITSRSEAVSLAVRHHLD